ncbi:MAG: LPS export ABC transporter permease LptF [Pseudomonadota bacterium]
MGRLDRYLYRQLLGPFAFFVLILTGIIWLSQSLRVIETVVNNGQSAMVFLEFTALLLPRVMSIVLPVAAFAATLYAINRLYADSELAVMFAAGRSGLALLRPVAVFSVTLLCLLLVVTLLVVPNTQRLMRDRISEVRGDVAAAFLRERAFITPTRNVTVFVREIGAEGTLNGIFIHDTREEEEQTATYTAERAVVLSEAGATRLVMFDGVAQITRPDQPEALSLLRFEQFAYDLSQIGGRTRERLRKPSELFVTELLAIDADEAERRLRPLGEFRAEAHEAISAPLYALAFPFLAVAIIVSTGFKRQGSAGRILFAVGIGAVLRLLGLALKSATAGQAFLWPTMYLPPLIGIAIACYLLSSRGLAPRRAGIATGVGALAAPAPPPGTAGPGGHAA